MLSRHCFIVAFAMATVAVFADDTQPSNEMARAKRLERMRERAASGTIIVNGDDKPVEAKLSAAPIMRYDDQPRRCIDATLWLWTVAERPVGICKVEDARP